MTNAQIILKNSIKLMEQGILKPTGKTFVYKDDEGNEREYQEPEQIHTYEAWKELGYQVKRGQKAKCSFTIWKYTQKEKDGEKEERMFMKKASFFTFDQVEAIA